MNVVSMKLSPMTHFPPLNQSELQRLGIEKGSGEEEDEEVGVGKWKQQETNKYVRTACPSAGHLYDLTISPRSC